MRSESEKCVVQARLEGIVAQLWESRKVSKLWNYAVQLPWKTVIAYFVVPVSKVTSLRAETVQ